jgi:MscS family membrane protein
LDAVIEYYLVPLSKRDDNDLDVQIVMMIERGVRILLWSVGIIVGLNNAGFDVGALIAGLGIGGLAVALAAQDTVKNIFGGITIFLDKPFVIGDRIIIKGLDGFVEYIGMRSTRLRTMEGRLITIPNGQFSENPIENITIEPSRRVVTDLGLTYDTSPEKIELALKLLKEISLQYNMSVIDEETKAVFHGFGESSLNIRFIYFIRKEADLFDVPHLVNMEILKRFNEHQIEFAFPTQTLYTKNSK